MKFLRIPLLALMAMATLSAITPTSERKEMVSNSQLKTVQEDSVLRHVVLFKFKEEASKEKVVEVEQAFGELPNKISQILSYEWGLNNSPEGLEKGFTHCFFVTFASESDRAIYLPNEDHQAFVALLKPHLEDVLVIDYWTK